MQVTVPMTGVPPGSPITARLTSVTGQGLTASPTAAVGSGIVERIFQRPAGRGYRYRRGRQRRSLADRRQPPRGAPMNFGIYHWTGTTWAELPGAATRIAVDPAVTPGSSTRATSSTTGTAPPGPSFPAGAPTSRVGANGAIWLIGASPLGGGNFGIYHWTGTTWARFPGAAVSIAVDPAGNPWVINSGHLIYHWNGTTWTQFPGGGTDISVGANGAIWLIGASPLGGGQLRHLPLDRHHLGFRCGRGDTGRRRSQRRALDHQRGRANLPLVTAQTAECSWMWPSAPSTSAGEVEPRSRSPADS